MNKQKRRVGRFRRRVTAAILWWKRRGKNEDDAEAEEEPPWVTPAVTLIFYVFLAIVVLAAMYLDKPPLSKDVPVVLDAMPEICVVVAAPSVKNNVPWLAGANAILKPYKMPRLNVEIARYRQSPYLLLEIDGTNELFAVISLSYRYFDMSAAPAYRPESLAYTILWSRSVTCRMPERGKRGPGLPAALDDSVVGLIETFLDASYRGWRESPGVSLPKHTRDYGTAAKSV